MPEFPAFFRNVEPRLSDAVKHFWGTREGQTQKQGASGQKDHGARGAVTGGAQMDAFIGLLTELVLAAGMDQRHIYNSKSLELPGFFRPTKEWDLLVVKDDQLIVAVETKSQVGSFGNNFNNRTEEAIGSAVDL